MNLNFQGYYECSACHVLAPDHGNLLQHECGLWTTLKSSFVSTTVNLERREHADVRLLITTHADNNHLFDGKATNKDAFEKIAEQFTKASGFSVKRRRGACKRMGLVTNGTLSSQTEIPRIPNRTFLNFFVNGKQPRCQECKSLEINSFLRRLS